ncbi:unnamed protein product, partial [Vitis vinifera]
MLHNYKLIEKDIGMTKLFSMGSYAYFTALRVTHMPLWRADGVEFLVLCKVATCAFRGGPYNRALHHHYLYSRYHSHHHSSIVSEFSPIAFL